MDLAGASAREVAPNIEEAKMPVGPDNTTYDVVARKDGTYAVKITKPYRMPHYQEGFESEAEAEDWIFRQMEPTGGGEQSYAGPPDSLPGHAPGSSGEED